MKTLETIVAFHIGRGGRFHNSGHVSFIGFKTINEFTSDLFVSYENYTELSEELKKYPNLGEKLQKCFEDDDFVFFKKKFGWNIGKKIFIDGGGSPVGLDVENDGTGIINIDYDYNTNYCKYLSECNEDELFLIKNSEFNC